MILTVQSPYIKVSPRYRCNAYQAVSLSWEIRKGFSKEVTSEQGFEGRVGVC